MSRLRRRGGDVLSSSGKIPSPEDRIDKVWSRLLLWKQTGQRRSPREVLKVQIQEALLHGFFLASGGDVIRSREDLQEVRSWSKEEALRLMEASLDARRKLDPAGFAQVMSESLKNADRKGARMARERAAPEGGDGSP